MRRKNSYELDICLPGIKQNAIDSVSKQLLDELGGYSGLTPIEIPAYGNCLPLTASYFMHGNKDHDTEVRVRIAVELALNAEDYYLNDQFLAMGMENCSSRTTAYAMFSDPYHPGKPLTTDDIQTIFQEETMTIVRPGIYMGIWQLHAIASILEAKV